MPTQAKSAAKPPPQQADPPRQLPLKATVNWLNPDEEGTIRATASLTIGGAFTVHGIKVIDGSKGQFVSMPSYQSGGKYKDIFHAVTAEARQQMNDAVLNAYNQKLAGQTQEDAPDAEIDDAPGAEEGQAMNSM